jgi:hypothetical protein
LTKLGLTQKKMSHHALDDARAQAEIFRAIRRRNVLHQA